MPLPDQASSASRILVALDATSSGVETLAAAAELAAQLQAELQGLFVEDVNLLRLASLPFAQEISLTPPVIRPMSLEVMERTLHGIADQIRESLSELAERLQLSWSFTVTRGRLSCLPQDMVEAADLLILGSPPRRLPSGRRTEVATRTGPVLVLYDGSPSSDRALSTALNVTRERPNELVLLLGDGESEASLRQRAAKALSERGRVSTVSLSHIESGAQLVDTVRRLRGRLLLLGREARLVDEATLATLVSVVGCPVGLVR